MNYARHVLKADVVISIGDLLDKESADIQLTSRISVEKAVQEVAQQAHKLRALSEH